MQKKKILAISGSTRQKSVNLNLILAIEVLFEQAIEVTIFNAIGDLPQFNPDIIEENIASSVNYFRQLVREKDAVLICTPEYAHGVPGALKNVIDWCVGSNEFYEKPTALITASTDGFLGHAALLETLKTIQCKEVEALNLVIPVAKTKINTDNKITDEKTKLQVEELINKMIQTIEAKQ